MDFDNIVDLRINENIVYSLIMVSYGAEIRDAGGVSSGAGPGWDPGQSAQKEAGLLNIRFRILARNFGIPSALLKFIRMILL
jgi:hypothetical protein